MAKLYIRVVNENAYPPSPLAYNVLSPDKKLMMNRIRKLIRNHLIVSADPEIGKILLVKLESLWELAQRLLGSPNEPHVVKKILMYEEIYKKLFGDLPVSYYELDSE